MQDIYYHFRFYVFLKRRIDKKRLVERYIEEVGYISEDGKMNVFYKNKDNKISISKLNTSILSLLDYEEDEDFKKYYVEGK